MAGVFGDAINSRNDFLSVLHWAKVHAAAALKKRPNDPTLLVVTRQITAIESWIANGRTPALDERKQIDLGLRMYREFEFDADAEIQQLRFEATLVQNYFRYWPDDSVARDPNNKDYVPYAD